MINNDTDTDSIDMEKIALRNHFMLSASLISDCNQNIPRSKSGTRGAYPIRDLAHNVPLRRSCTKTVTF